MTFSLNNLSFFLFFCLKKNYLAQKRLKQLKNQISTQSKKNFLLERDVRYLDTRIALLIQSRKAQEDMVISLISFDVKKKIFDRSSFIDCYISRISKKIWKMLKLQWEIILKKRENKFEIFLISYLLQNTKTNHSIQFNSALWKFIFFTSN